MECDETHYRNDQLIDADDMALFPASDNGIVDTDLEWDFCFVGDEPKPLASKVLKLGSYYVVEYRYSLN